MAARDCFRRPPRIEGAFSSARRLPISFVGDAMLGSLRNKGALHSHCRDNRRLRGSLVCKLSHGRRDPRRGQHHRQSRLPHPDLSRLHRDRFLPADGARPEIPHRRRVLGGIARDRGLARRHGPVGRDPGLARSARIRRAYRRRADWGAGKEAPESLSGTGASQRARSLAARASYAAWRSDGPAR